MGWQAKAPAPQWCKPLPGNVGQALSPVNTAIPAIISQLPHGRGSDRSRGGAHQLSVPMTMISSRPALRPWA
jgi:hypothetical protein